MPQSMRPTSKLIKRRGSPRYYVEVRVRDPKTGLRVKFIRSTGETTKEKALAAIADIEADALEELYATEARTSSKQPIGDFIEEYYRKHGRSLARSTQDDYRSVTNPFVEWFGIDTPLSALPVPIASNGSLTDGLHTSSTRDTAS